VLSAELNMNNFQQSQKRKFNLEAADFNDGTAYSGESGNLQ